MSKHYLDPDRSQYELYRDLARALYALALDAVRARDMERATWICESTMPLQEPMGYVFDAVGSPAFEIVECTNVATILNFTDDIWDRNLRVLEGMKDSFFEVLGD